MHKLQHLLNELLNSLREFRSSFGPQSQNNAAFEHLDNQLRELAEYYKVNGVRIENKESKATFRKYDFLLTLAPTAIAVVLFIFVLLFTVQSNGRTSRIVHEGDLIQQMSNYYENAAKTLLDSKTQYSDTTFFIQAIEYMRKGDSLRKILDRQQPFRSRRRDSVGFKD